MKEQELLFWYCTLSGLRDPILFDADGKQPVDGRNRLQACKLAKVEPRFGKLPEGSDVLAYSRQKISCDVTSPRPEVMAMMYSEIEKGGRGKKRRQFHSYLAKASISAYVLGNRIYELQHVHEQLKQRRIVIVSMDIVCGTLISILDNVDRQVEMPEIVYGPLIIP